jgi:cytochrome c-type biogenesis protein CcmE
MLRTIPRFRAQNGGTFKAETVLAKHDENYMPREVVETQKKHGHWQEIAAPKIVPYQGQCKVSGLVHVAFRAPGSAALSIVLA